MAMSGPQSTDEHNFVDKTLLKQEECFSCKRKIAFSSLALKCKTCKIVSHFTCKMDIPHLCVPKTTRSPFQKRKKIFKFPLNPGIEIPQFLVDCIMEIDRRGQSSSPFPLYTFTHKLSDIEHFKQRILEGSVDWAKVKDVNIICAAVLDILWSLTEPILPHESWLKLVNALNATTNAELHERLTREVLELPQNVRDTIAFIVMHVQKVSKRFSCDASEMILAEKFALGVIGVYDGTKPSKVRQLSVLIMVHLLSLDPEFWKDCIKQGSHRKLEMNSE